jgi:hypothetical protein
LLLIIIRYSNISVYCKIVIFIYTIPLASNQVNTVNGMAFEYTGKDEIHLKIGRFDRIYFEDMFEYDPVNNFHLHRSARLAWQGFLQSN